MILEYENVKTLVINDKTCTSLKILENQLEILFVLKICQHQKAEFKRYFMFLLGSVRNRFQIL